MAFQNFALYPAYDGASTTSPARCGARGWHQARSSARVDEVATLLRIDHVLGHYAARALQRPEAAHRARPRAGRAAPACCCSTIPCATSTPSCATRCAWSCRALLASFGSTVLYVTQDYQGGHGARRPHRRAARRRIRAGRHAGTRSIASPRTSRSRACSAIRPSTSIRCRRRRTAAVRGCSASDAAIRLPRAAPHVAGATLHARASGPRIVEHRRRAGARRHRRRARRGDAAQRARRPPADDGRRRGTLATAAEDATRRARPRPSRGLGALRPDAVPALRPRAAARFVPSGG